MPTRSPADRPIRVLLIAPSLDILGGQAVQASRLMRELGKNPSLEMIFLPMNPRLPGPFRWLQKIKYVRTVLTVLWFCTLLSGRVWRTDIVHVFSAAYFSFLWAPAPALIAARLLGKKAILNFRDGQAEGHLTRWAWTNPILRLADEIVSPSGFLVDVFGKFGFRARSIYNVIDMERFHYRQRRRLRPVFLHNRILEPLYDVDTTLRAFQIIQRSYPHASLTIAHDGVCRPGLEKVAAELRLRNTEFVGRVPHDKIPDLYDSVDIYLTSPVYDCMPGSLLECSASGLPIVATNAGGIPYIVEDEKTALLVPCGDHEAMAQRAMRLLEDEELVVRLTTRAREECRKFTWPEVGEKWVRLYHELTGRLQREAVAAQQS